MPSLLPVNMFMWITNLAQVFFRNLLILNNTLYMLPYLAAIALYHITVVVNKTAENRGLERFCVVARYVPNAPCDVIAELVFVIDGLRLRRRVRLLALGVLFAVGAVADVGGGVVVLQPDRVAVARHRRQRR